MGERISLGAHTLHSRGMKIPQTYFWIYWIKCRRAPTDPSALEGDHQTYLQMNKCLWVYICIILCRSIWCASVLLPEGFLGLCITLHLNLSEQRQSGRYFSFLAPATNSFPILFIVCSLFSWRRRRRRFNKAVGAPEKEERRPYLAFLNFNPTAIPATSSHIYLSTLFV